MAGREPDLIIGWPADSPDLNSIKHIWKLLNANVKKIFPHLEILKINEVNKAELSRWIKLARDAITPQQMNNLIDPLPCKMAFCVRAQS